MKSTRNIKPETTFGEEVLHGLKDFQEAVERGESITVRTVKLDLDPRHYSPAQIKSLRKKLGVSQAVFAKLLAVSVELVQHWEQGIRSPAGIARRLLEEVDGDPDRWLARLVAKRPARAHKSGDGRRL